MRGKRYSSLLIPPYIVFKLAKKHKVDKKSRTFSPWSHVVSMIFAHLSHALSRNGLSHANKVRSSDMAKDLFYEVLAHFSNSFPRFGRFDLAFKNSDSKTN